MQKRKITVKGLLTRDWIERKTRKWHLLSSREMEKMCRISDAYDINEVYYIRPSFINIRETDWRKIEWKAISKIQNWFPHAKTLLDKFKGKIVAAGGAICRSFWDNSHVRPNDIDLFCVDEIRQDENKYTELLTSSVSFLVSELQSIPGGTVYVTRNEYVTTVSYFSDDDVHEQKYQFVQRVYPNIGSVLGGFDIGVCMIAYTGERIVATELGAWSVFNSSIIVDTSRRSTSYEHRLTKYSWLCRIILPGLTSPIVEESFKDWKSYKEVSQELVSILNNENVHVDYFQGEYPAFYDDEDNKKDDLIEKIYDLANEYGYYVNHLELQAKDDSRQDGRFMNTELEARMAKLLKAHAYKRGFNLDVEEFKGAQLEGYDSNGLTSRSRVFKMPYLSIKAKSDYGGPPVFTTKMSFGERKYHVKMSDYADRPTWASLTVVGNITCLSNGEKHLKGAMSITVFKRPHEDVQPVHVDHEGYSDFIKTIEAVHETTNPKEIEEIIKNSFEKPYLGDLKKAFQLRLASYRRTKSWGVARHEQYYAKPLFGPYGEEDLDLVEKQIEENAVLVRENLKGVKWILDNPGRQWTSSNNPIIADPGDWYGPSYRSFRIGCEEIEIAIRLLRLRKESPFFGMDRNILNYIIRLVVWENSYLA